MSYERNPVYQNIINWLKQHEVDLRVESIAQHEPKFYQDKLPEVRAFRKEVIGTEKLGALLTSDERQRAVTQIQERMKEELEVANVR